MKFNFLRTIHSKGHQLFRQISRNPAEVFWASAINRKQDALASSRHLTCVTFSSQIRLLTLDFEGTYRIAFSMTKKSLAFTLVVR